MEKPRLYLLDGQTSAFAVEGLQLENAYENPPLVGYNPQVMVVVRGKDKIRFNHVSSLGPVKTDVFMTPPGEPISGNNVIDALLKEVPWDNVAVLLAPPSRNSLANLVASCYFLLKHEQYTPNE
ncbi:hypothetical protein HYU13_01495 [Candidatus Woesearchaeota archaeon]|nr:hypothetical protein [Candidatus Woesearchaeota archaeon]